MVYVAIYLLFFLRGGLFLFCFCVHSLSVLFRPENCLLMRAVCSKLYVCERSFIYCTANSLGKAIFRQFWRRFFFFFKALGSMGVGWRRLNCNDFPLCHLAVFQGFSLRPHWAIWGACFLISPGRLPVSLGGNSLGTGFNWGHPPWRSFPALSREMEALNVMHIKTSRTAGQAPGLWCPEAVIMSQFNVSFSKRLHPIVGEAWPLPKRALENTGLQTGHNPDVWNLPK